MATTTATLTLSSADLSGDALALSNTATLTKAGTLTGLDQTTGVARKTYTTTSIQTLVDKADFADDKAHKVYIKNTSNVATENLIVTIESQLLGRLYAGDFMFIPFNGDQDIKITPSVATAMTVEFLVIYES
mgnify:CR=1 FL=1|jgi:hypothetical protein|tara:strand:+ start:1206 stop:1601 length:396 start_codon:yes stop_codon:yes gene_type:complete